MVKQLKVLVTGGAGFIGSHLVDRLIESGHQVVVVDNLSKGNCIFVHPKAQFILEDITAPRLGGIFKLEQPEVVFHEAAQIDVQTSVRKPQADAQVNIQGTINVLEACINSGVKKVIYASSAAAYGNPQYLGIDEQHPIDPLSPYGISKHTVEHYLKVYHQLHGLKYTVLRYANVYGPRQDIQGEGGVVSIFINKLLRNQSLTIDGSGEQTRDFIYVHDVVRANLASLDYGDNQIVNVGTGVKTSINELYDLLKQLCKATAAAQYGPSRTGDIAHSYFDPSFAKRLLSWEPVYALPTGLAETVKFYKSYI